MSNERLRPVVTPSVIRWAWTVLDSYDFLKKIGCTPDAEDHKLLSEAMNILDYYQAW